MADIRKAEQADFAAVIEWLRAEYEANGSYEGFYCNQDQIVESFDEGNMYVVVEAGLGLVGFVTEGYAGPDIVEVHPDHRGKGYGRQIAEWIIARARRRDDLVIELECSPETSLPFWEAMGFVKFRGGSLFSGPRARMILRPTTREERHRGYGPGLRDDEEDRTYTGEPCEHGHTERRWRGHECYECWQATGFDPEWLKFVRSGIADLY
jgi:GNAT superfamily N-acetyltransferase